MASGSRLIRCDSKESVLSISSCISGIGNWQVGDRARIGGRSGTIAFVGPTKFAPGEWIGLVLDEQQGKNDGSVHGQRYFNCTPDHGLFCKSSKLERIVLSPSRFKSPTPGFDEPLSPFAKEFGFDMGERVMISGGKTGILRYLGETEFAQGIWAGVELDQPLGKNDGSVQGKRYFTCKTPYGVFAAASKIQRAALQTPVKMKIHHTKTSLLRQKQRIGGSQESISSIGRSSIASSRLGGMKRVVIRPNIIAGSGIDSTINALQEALKEKDKHLEQMMTERDLERNEIAQLTTRCERAEMRLACEGYSEISHEFVDKLAKAENDKKALRTEVMEKDKIIEDLNFRIEEETISKDCQIIEMEKKIELLREELDSQSANESKKLNGRIYELEEEITRLNGVIIQASENNESTIQNTGVKRIQVILSAVEKERDELRIALNDEKSSLHKMLLEAKKQKDDFEVAFKDLSNDKAAIKKQLATEQYNVQHLTTDLENTRKIVGESDKKLAKVLGDLSSSLKCIEEQKHIIESITSDKGLAEKELNLLIQNLQKERNQLEDTTRIMEEKIKYMEVITARKENDIKELTDQLLSMQENCTNLQKQACDAKYEYTQTVEKIKDLKEDIGKFVITEQELRTSLEKEQKLASERGASLEELETISKLSRMGTEKKIAKLETELINVRNDKHSMEAEVARNTDFLRTKESDLLNLHSILKDKEKSENKQIVDLELEKAGINDELKSVLKKCEELSDKCMTYENLNLKLEKQLMDDEIRFTDTIVKMEDDHRRFVKKWKNDEKELMDNMRSSKENEIAQQRELATVREQIVEKNLEIKKLQKNINDLEQNLEKNTQSLEKLSSENIELDSRVKKTMEKIGEYSNQAKMAIEANETAEKTVLSLNNQIVALKQQLEAAITTSECEYSRLLAEMKAEKSKLQAELREADAEKIKLAKEVTLNVEDLAKLRVQHEERIKHEYEEKLSIDEMHKLELELSHLKKQLRKTEDNFRKQISDLMDVSVQQSEQIDYLRSSNEILKGEKETLHQENSRLLSDIDKLNVCLASVTKVENNLRDELTISRKDQGGKKNLPTLTEEINTNSADKRELEEKLMKLQDEVQNLRISQLDADNISREAKQKLELLSEVEEDWQEKNLRLTEQIEDLTLQLEASRKLTQNGEILSLTKQVEFLHSIIADQQNKERNMQEKIDILTNSPVGLTEDSPYISFAKNGDKRRLYCDICEEFDRHETEDCPTQDLENSGLSKYTHFEEKKKTRPPPRKYCDQCEARRPVMINTASIYKSPSQHVVSMEDSHKDLDDHTAEHLSLFGSIKQGNDTCQLQSVCVPIPIENENPQVIIYPKCYEVMQCVGSCCDSFERCHPHSIRKLQKPIVEMIYVGSGRFMLNKTINITMEEHTSCSCYECGLNISQCPPGFVLGPSCKCECANSADRDSCLGNHIWNEHNCTCNCEHIICSKNNILDRERCECISQKEKSELVDSLISARTVDLSSLPKLRAKVSHRNQGL